MLNQEDFNRMKGKLSEEEQEELDNYIPPDNYYEVDILDGTVIDPNEGD